MSLTRVEGEEEGVVDEDVAAGEEVLRRMDMVVVAGLAACRSSSPPLSAWPWSKDMRKWGLRQVLRSRSYGKR